MCEPEETLRRIFPRLCTEPFEITSPCDASYNCVAWAAGDTGRWWEPDPFDLYYWPDGVTRDYTVEAYSEAFRVLGYDVAGAAGAGEEGQRVAIYGQGGVFKHVCRSLEDGWWTSKIGKKQDIRHNLRGIGGQFYGEVVLVMKQADQVQRS